MNDEKQRQLVEKLIIASTEIEKSRRDGKAQYITLSESYIKQIADENNLSFDDMVKIIEDELNPKHTIKKQ